MQFSGVGIGNLLGGGEGGGEGGGGAGTTIVIIIAKNVQSNHSFCHYIEHM